MPEDIREQASEAAGTTEPVASQADVADEEDLDVVLERVAPKRSGGCGWVGWIVGLAILAVLAYVGWQQWDRQQQEKAAAARQQRMDQYQANKGEIRDKLDRAAKDASAGHIDAAIDVLEAAEVQWGQLAQGAQGQGDPEVANEATMKKAALAETVQALQADQAEATKLTGQAKELEAQIKALQAKQDEINARVRDRILQVAGQGDEPAATGQAAKPAATEPASQPAAPEQPAQPAPAEPQAAKPVEPAAPVAR